jgi:hypothetical protein
MAVNFLDGIIVGGELTATGSTNNITTTNGSSSLYLLNLTRTTTSLTTAGSVGIGTTSPATKLHVSNGDIRIDNSKQLQFGSGGVRINNDSAGRMYQRAPLDFYWETQGYQMVLRQSGNLGIGTTSPGEKLEVAGKIKITGTANFIDTTRNASSQANYIRFYDSSTSSVEAYVGYTSNNRDFKVDSANGSGTLTLNAGGNTGIRISDTGNVGVGTTSPTKKLDVDGTARFRNDTQVDKAFMADSYVSSANGPFGPQPGINAVAVIATKNNQITLTFASGLLIGYVCEGEECPEQPPNIFMEEG